MHDNQAEGDERGMPIMVIKDRNTRIIRARVVPQAIMGTESRC